MEGYKRPTKILKLPSGKKVEIVEYFSNYEMEEIQGIIGRDIKVKGGNKKNVFEGEDLKMENMIESFRKAKEIAIKKLIDVDGKEYKATEQSVKDFIPSDDSLVFDTAIKEMIVGKKK